MKNLLISLLVVTALLYIGTTYLLREVVPAVPDIKQQAVSEEIVPEEKYSVSYSDHRREAGYHLPSINDIAIKLKEHPGLLFANKGQLSKDIDLYVGFNNTIQPFNDLKAPNYPSYPTIEYPHSDRRKQVVGFLKFSWEPPVLYEFDESKNVHIYHVYDPIGLDQFDHLLEGAITWRNDRVVSIKFDGSNDVNEYWDLEMHEYQFMVYLEVIRMKILMYINTINNTKDFEGTPKQVYDYWKDQLTTLRSQLRLIDDIINLNKL